MSDTPPRPVDYTPEEGAEVRPAPRYSVSPGSYETLTREVSVPETPYRSMSVLAIVSIVVAVGYSILVGVGGLAAFWTGAWWVLALGTVLVPLLALPVALKLNIRDTPGLFRAAGLALAGFYAGPIGIIGLIAFPNQSPWLLPLWTLMFPLAAIVIALAARLGIQNSEGTLGGKLLTTWAICLSLVFALCYTAFYAATDIAVTQQAEQFATGWIDSLKKDELEKAFVMTLPVTERSSDTMSHDQIESYNIRHINQDGPSGPGQGAFAAFSQRHCVRLLSRSANVTVKLVNVLDWGYEAGGYKVQLYYEAKSDYWNFPIKLTVFGADAKGDIKTRRWQVTRESPFLMRLDVKKEPKGELLTTGLWPAGQHFATQWANKLWNNQEFDALNDTLGADKKEKMARAACALAVGGGAGLWAYESPDPFFQGALVKTDEPGFWAPEGYRQQLIGPIKQMFAPSSNKPRNLQVQDPLMTLPSWTEVNGRLVFRYDMEIGLLVPIKPVGGEGETVVSPVLVAGWLFVSCPAEALETGKPTDWRIEKMELVRGRRLEPSGRGGPGIQQKKVEPPPPPR